MTSETARATDTVQLDLARSDRVGMGEAVLCEPKTTDQIVTVLEHAEAARHAMLLTRLAPERFARLPTAYRDRLDYEPLSATAFLGEPAPVRGPADIAVVTGGTSDVGVAREAVRTLSFHGHAALEIYDVGVAGLWRLERRLPELAEHKVVVALAGMDAALPTVLAGLVPGLVIAVPTSVGYGVAEGGHTALRSLLASCAPGLVVTNIDNGYGAACAAMRSLR